MAKNKDDKQHGDSMAQPRNREESGQQTALAQSRNNPQLGMSRRSGVPGPFNPFSLMRRFGEDLEQLFDEFGFGRLAPRGFEQMAAWTPQVEVLQRDKELVIRADLPGINKDNVKVELGDDSIVLRGERQEERKEEREGFLRTERSYGSFYREISVPPNVDTSKATATFRDGVLEITMPFSEGEGRRRQLEIEDAKTEEQPKQQRHAAVAGR
nr:Hsp20/alpha crystallin family [uncultured bacterium]